MQIIIDIPEEIYQKIKEANRFISGKRSGKRFDYIIYKAINMGTPIPKGHGRIIDESKITHTWWETKEELRLERLECVNKHRYVVLRGTDAPTIVEAERSKEK